MKYYTQIPLQEKTKKKLKSMVADNDYKSYDELINKMICKFEK